MTFYIDQIRDEFDKDGNRTLKGCVTPVYQTYYTSHMLGQCYKCQDQPVVYLNTPKCASSFMKTQVLDLGWQQGFLDLGPKEVPEDMLKVNVDDIEKIIVVMRDPYDRWLSGIAEYFGEEPDGEIYAEDVAYKVMLVSSEEDERLITLVIKKQ